MPKRIRLLPAVLAILFFAAPAARAQTASEPVAQTKTVHLDVVDVSKTLTWQAEQGGAGEYLAAPIAPITAPLAWGAQTFIGTPTGVIYSTTPVPGDEGAKPTWTILPALYGQPVRPLGDQKGMLALQKGEPFTDSARGLVLLDDGLHVAKELPDIKGYCVYVEPNGFWMLDNMQTAPVTAKGPTALVHYDADGNETQRFATDGNALPKGQIFWAGSSPNAIWLAVFSYKGVGKDGIPDWNTRQMVHVDPTTGKADSSDITAPGGAGFVQLADKIVWLEPPATGDSWELEQLDKTTLAVSKAGAVTLKGVPDSVAAVNDMTATDKYIWIRPVPTAPPVVIGAENFGAVPLATAGPWPGYQPSTFTLWASSTTHGDISGTLAPIAADAQRVWFLTPDANIIALGDDGAQRAYALGSAAGTPPAFTSATSINGNLYLQLPTGELLLIKVTGGDATSIAYPKVGFMPYFVASTKRLWLTNSRQLLTIAPGDPDRNIVLFPGAGKPPTINLHQMVAIDNDLYFLQWGDAARSLVLWRADGDDPHRAGVASWLKTYGGGPRRETWARKWASTARTPDGQLLFEPPFTPNAKATLFDPQDNSWNEVPYERNIVWSTNGPKRLIGFDPDGAAYNWKDTKWEPLSKTPTGLKPIGPVFGTTRYLYVPTALGIYRVEWVKIP